MMAEILKFTRSNEREKMRESLRGYLAEVVSADEMEACVERLLTIADAYTAPEYDFSIDLSIPIDLPQATRQAISEGIARAITAHRGLVEHAVRDRLTAERRILELERELRGIRSKGNEIS